MHNKLMQIDVIITYTNMFSSYIKSLPKKSWLGKTHGIEYYVCNTLIFVVNGEMKKP